MKISFNQWIPILIYIFVFLCFGVSILAFAPSWGFMDDLQNLTTLDALHQSSDPVEFVTQRLLDMQGGFMRPVYQFWVLTMYSLFREYPTGLYLLIMMLNMGSLLIWGRVFVHYFNVPPQRQWMMTFLFPLSFFIFTPFWNVFMYLSLQEKFIVWAAAIGLYFFERAYAFNRKRYAVYAYVSVILALLSKPTGIFLPVIFAAFAFFDVIVFKKNIRLSIINLLTGFLISVSYAFFTFKYQLTSSYTNKYKSGLGVSSFLGKFLNSSLYLQVLFLLGIVFFLIFFIQSLRKKEGCSPFSILLPMGLIVYLTILIPWGGQTYLQCALSPLIFSLGVPIFLLGCSRQNFFRYLFPGLLTILVFLVVFMIAIPRIRKMAEKGYVVQFLKDQSLSQGGKRYFYPPPFLETAFALKGFSGEDVVYLKDGLNKEMLLEDGENFLLYDDQARPIALKDISVKKPIYESHTWKVYPIEFLEGAHSDVTSDFPQNFLQVLKQTIKRLK